MVGLENILSKFPIFSSLDAKGIKELASISHLRDFKKGQTIYKENDRPDNLNIVIFGRIKTYTKASLREKRVLDYLYKGTCFGIISLLTNQPHSVSAESANDSLVAQIPKDKFTAFLKKYPLLAVEFSKMLSRRVKKRFDKDKNIFESLIIAVYSIRQHIANTVYSTTLAKALAEESGKKVIAVEVKNKKSGWIFSSSDAILQLSKFNETTFKRYVWKKMGFDYVGVSYLPESSYASKIIPLFLSFLTQIYNFIILDLPPTQDSLTITALFQSDFIHCLSSEESPDLLKLKTTLDDLKDTYRIKEDTIKIVLSGHSKIIAPCKQTYPFSNILAALPRFNEKNALKVIGGYPKGLYARAIRRIARDIASVRVGLALGSGAAFTFAHIGVLKVLEEHDIDIDVVSGSSMGSVTAALWGLGYNWRKIKKMAHKFEQFPVFSFFDICLSKKSFFRGQRLRQILRELFDNYTAYDFKRPVMVVSFDFLRKEPHVFTRGNFLIRKAVLASCSIPGIFAPVKRQDDLFLDGGVLNPLPVGCLVEDGIKKIISVNVTPSKEELRRSFKEGPAKKKLNVLDFIFGSIEAMQREFIQDAVSFSDVVIHPSFKNVAWTEFKKIDYFIEQGEKAALKQIDSIRQLQQI